MLRQAVAGAPKATYLDTVIIRPLTQHIDYKIYLTMTRDPDFKAVIRLGIGGTGRDIFRDCVIGLPPLHQLPARRLIEESKAHTMLRRHKGRTPFDLLQLELTMINFSNLIVDFPEISAIDIDPIVIANQNITALDARISLYRKMAHFAGSHSHLVITPYPTRYTRPWRLNDGNQVLLRPVRPDDEPMLLELFKSLSERTRSSVSSAP